MAHKWALNSIIPKVTFERDSGGIVGNDFILIVYINQLNNRALKYVHFIPYRSCSKTLMFRLNQVFSLHLIYNIDIISSVLRATKLIP